MRLEASPDASAEWMIGRSPGMQAVYKAIGRVASRNVTVLIRGESGTGKELVARALFQFGNRSSGPFMAINCAAIPEALLESELFGHEKGAFTGAERQRIGRFEQCNSGTLFLDEVGDMSPTLQSKLLRVLQQQQFERIGGNQTIQTDVRLIAATNRDLERMVADGLFRSDLYYRLNGFSIELPPLRDRVEDLEPLIDHFRQLANQDLGKEVLQFSEQAIERLRHYHWPGNVRQLQSVVRQAVLQTTGPVVLPDFLPSLPTTRTQAAPAASRVRAVETDELLELIETKVSEGETNLYDRVIDEAEKLLLTRVLRMTGGNQVEAAKILGITRTTLRSKILKLGITISQTVESG
jgi:two-component system nitrogen regulation response regulator GlnG